MKYLLLTSLLFIVSCTTVDVKYTRPDGTVVEGTYASTKTQISPKFILERNETTTSIQVGSEQATGVDPKDVVNLVNSVADVLKPAP